jgi:hypothetical protein
VEQSLSGKCRNPTSSLVLEPFPTSKCGDMRDIEHVLIWISSVVKNVLSSLCGPASVKKSRTQIDHQTGMMHTEALRRSAGCQRTERAVGARGRGCGELAAGADVPAAEGMGRSRRALMCRGLLWRPRAYRLFVGSVVQAGDSGRAAPVWRLLTLLWPSSIPSALQIKMFTTLWMWREEYQHHEQLPLAFNGTWPSWNSDLDNRPW